MENQERVDSLRIALVELTDALNRCSAVIERNTQAVQWHMRVLIWIGTPWWRRGTEPK